MNTTAQNDSIDKMLARGIGILLKDIIDMDIPIGTEKVADDKDYLEKKEKIHPSKGLKEMHDVDS